ncbi:hypothetical protein HMPREF1982_02539 [Clostridiales bacterium oral taxon 876 str. F0540]|nr:hypothetical protein HMPREF1982_02539 [Clostridiales bacterium oral taxon 876 str. F0540]
MKTSEKTKFAFIFGDLILGLLICIIYSFYKFYFMRYYGFNTVLFNIIIPDILILLISYFIGLVIYSLRQHIKSRNKEL